MYEEDIRHIVRMGSAEAADRRLRAFRHGWTDAVNGLEYKREGLREVKWQNLGWRFGRILGQISAESQAGIFEILADLQVAQRVDATNVADE